MNVCGGGILQVDSWLHCMDGGNALAATESSKNGIQKVIICKSHISVGRKFYGAGEIEILGIRFPGDSASR